MIKYSLPFVLGVASGALAIGAWYIVYPNNAEAPAVVADIPEIAVAGTKPDKHISAFSGEPESFIQDTNGVSVRNQRAGATVSVDTASLANDGWVVVHEEILDGVIGNALGAARRDAGEHTNIIIDLLRNTQAGKHYWIAIYADNGDHIFSLKDDTPLFGTTGELLLAGFTVTE